MEITYELTYRQDDTPVRRNAVASGDDKYDRKVEDQILEELDRGDEFAWALVEVTARVKIGSRLFTGRASLGACSYESDADLRRRLFDGPEFDYDLKRGAREDLLLVLEEEVIRGEVAKDALRELCKEGR